MGGAVSIHSLTVFSAVKLYLCVDASHIPSAEIHMFADILYSLVHLQQLELWLFYDEEVFLLLMTLSSLSSLVALDLRSTWKCDLVEYTDEEWMCMLTNVTRLKAACTGPHYVASLPNMPWLSSLELTSVQQADPDVFSAISMLTRLTSLVNYSQHLDTPRCSFLAPLEQLASCKLHAVSCYNDHNSINKPVEKVMQHGSDVLFCVSALTHLDLFAGFPDETSECSDTHLSDRLQSLKFKGFGEYLHTSWMFSQALQI